MKLKDVVLWLIIGFVFIGVLTHAYGFATAAGTLFSGTNTLGKTLEGSGSTAGSAPPKS
jgi:hypothetical protein